MTKDQTDGLLTALYGVHRNELLRFLIARTGSRDDAEELLQEIWVRAQGPVTRAPIANGRAYIFRMAQNLVVDRLRQAQRRKRRESMWHEESAGGIAGGMEPIDISPNAKEVMLEREEIARIASALRTLPDGARRVFELHKLHDLPHAEIASKLKISKSGMEKHMAVAMKYFRRALLD